MSTPAAAAPIVSGVALIMRGELPRQHESCWQHCSNAFAVSGSRLVTGKGVRCGDAAGAQTRGAGQLPGGAARSSRTAAGPRPLGHYRAAGRQQRITATGAVFVYHAQKPAACVLLCSIEFGTCIPLGACIRQPQSHALTLINLAQLLLSCTQWLQMNCCSRFVLTLQSWGASVCYWSYCLYSLSYFLYSLSTPLVALPCE